jgi:CubicO group peptidase (beta-lactamase class C family)
MLVGQQADGLRSSGVDAEHEHSDDNGNPLTFSEARQVLTDAVSARAFPAAVVEVGNATRPLWSEAFGRLTFDPASAPAEGDTVFDLASLTKVLATTPLVMQLVERGAIGLDDPVGRHVAAWRGADREEVTIRDLLAHCSGLPAYRPYYLRARGDEAFAAAIANEALEYVPRSRSVYSDLDFLLLGLILGGSLALPDRMAALAGQMGVVDPLQFRPPSLWRKRIAPTAYDAWRGSLLTGAVDDRNAWALGGIAGHAGLFGTAAAVGAAARHLLQVLNHRVGAFSRETLLEFVTRRADIPGSSRALGWDTMLPTSSCGTCMSPRACGHTGYTGTSLWIDPDRAVYVVLLTNRVHPDRMNGAISAVRPMLHDAVMRAFD